MPDTRSDTTWIELSAAALRHNVDTVKQLAPKAAIVAMIKGNGYGHGAEWIADTLGDRVQGVAVARLNEAQQLRRHGLRDRLLLLGTQVDATLLQHCADLMLDLVIHDLAGVEQLCQTPLSRPLTVWLKLNVGMNRLGLSPNEFGTAHQRLSNCPQVAAVHHMSHFSDADDLHSDETHRQIQRLRQHSIALGQWPMSMANSAGIIAHPDSHADWVRPGIMLYGDDPTLTLAASALQPVMRFKSQIISIRTLHVGDGVGYNRRWRARGGERLATVAVGYADGYPRHAPDGTPVLVRGQRAWLAGRVSMDLTTIDISHIPEAELGDEVTLWGEGLSAAEVGRHCGTISYELFTRITNRVARYYL